MVVATSSFCVDAESVETEMNVESQSAQLRFVFPH